MRSPVRVLALVGVLAAVTLAAVVLRGSFDMPLRGRQGDDPSQARRGRPLGSSAGPATLVDPDSGEDVVARALRLAAIDTTKKKQWVDDIPDLELGRLSPA